MDCSNFLEAIPSTFKPEIRGKFGYLKSEVGCKVIVEAVALAAKLYSIFSKDRVSGQHLTKSAVKEFPPGLLEMLIITKASSISSKRRVTKPPWQNLTISGVMWSPA